MTRPTHFISMNQTTGTVQIIDFCNRQAIATFKYDETRDDPSALPRAYAFVDNNPHIILA